MEEFAIANYSETLCSELFKKLKHAVLFVDRNMAECLHWNGGFARLMASDVKCIKEFSPFERAPESCSKAIFVVSSLIINPAIQKTLKLIIENSDGNLDYCIVVTIASHQSHVMAHGQWRDINVSVEGRPIFDSFESNMLSWMGNRNYTAEVIHIPLSIGSLTDDVFLTLPFGDMVPHLDEGNFHSDFHRLRIEEKNQIETFAACWNSLFTTLDVKEDIYCVGPMSSIIGTQLVNMPSAKIRRKIAINNVSLLLLDRTSDLIAPNVSEESSAMDHVLSSHKVLPGHHSERIVSSQNSNKEDLPPFTIFEHCKNADANNLLQHLIEKPLNDVLEIAVQSLDSLAHKHSLSRKTAKSQKLNYERHLRDLLRSLDEQNNFDYPAVYQICSSLLQPLKNASKVTDLFEILSEMELIYQFSDALSKFQQFSAEKNLSLEVDIQCLIMLYSLAAGESLKWISDELEMFIVSKLVKVKRNDPIFCQTGAPAVAQKIISKLKNVARLRDVLPPQKRINPYIVDLLERIFDPNQPALPELACKTSGLAEALKSSLSLLMKNVRKPNRPNDAKTIIIFVTGGICCYEIAAVRRKLKHLKNLDHNIILGGTRLVTSKDILKQFLIDISEEE